MESELVVKILTAVVSVAALVLSQLPPIKQLLKGKKLRLAVADRAQLSHFFGNTNMTLWLDIENVGGRTLTVRSVRCYLLCDGVPVQPLAARTYVITESLSREKPAVVTMPEIALKIGDRWSGYIQLYDNRAWTTDIEHKLKTVIRKIKEDVSAKAIARDDAIRINPKLTPPGEGLVDADQLLLNELVEIKNNLKKVVQGNYSLLVAAYEDSDGKPLKVLGFEFTLFKEDIGEVFENVDDWKHGYGIQWPARKNNFTWIGMVAQVEAEAVQKYKDLPRELTRPYQGASGVIVVPT
jgi:hypothetical protein